MVAYLGVGLSQFYAKFLLSETLFKLLLLNQWPPERRLFESNSIPYRPLHKTPPSWRPQPIIAVEDGTSLARVIKVGVLQADSSTAIHATPQPAVAAEPLMRDG